MRRIFGIFLYCSILSLVACGGGGSSTPKPTPTPFNAATVSPSSASVALGSSQQFTATNFSGTVTWALSGPGSITQTGLYSAPAAFPSPNTITVTATAGGQTASVTGAVVYPNDNANNQSAPVKLGTSGGNVKDNNTANTACCIGTLGSLIQRGASTFILSNNHVLDRSAQGAPGEAIDQPGQMGCPAGSQGLLVGNLVQGAPLKPASGTTGPSPSNVDAAIASITAAIDTTDPILDLGAAGATSIAAAPPSSTTMAPSVGLAVAKSGRTTGLTCSTVDAINETVSVQYDSSCGGALAFTSTFSNQVDVAGGSFSGEGDSGSLIVTSASRQPVALLYAGNTTSTVGNPIGDVLTAFASGGVTPTIVGPAAPQPPVSCAPTASVNSVQVPGSFTPAVLTISEHERARVVAVKEKYEAVLAKNPAVVSVDMGASGDSPGEGALVVELSQPSRTGVPAALDGVRTKVVFSEGIAVPPRELTAQDIGSATSVKEAHVADLMSSPGIQGVGVGRSKDNPDETAIVIFTVTGVPHPDIPPVLDGIRTQVIEGTRFHAR